MTDLDSLGPQYTVTERGLCGIDGQVESRGVNPGCWSAIKVFPRVYRGEKFVKRYVTGRDPVIQGGLLHGVPLTMKSGLPTHVESVTEWMIDNG